MKCSKCKNKAVSSEHGLCKYHFIKYFESKVINTIKERDLFSEKSKLCVAVSGGKDSCIALVLSNKYLFANKCFRGNKNNKKKGKQDDRENAANIRAVAIDEGIKGYRQRTLRFLRSFCRQNEIPLDVYSFRKEFGASLDQIIKKFPDKNPCHVCGVLRRYLLNKAAAEKGCDVLVTGHNLDDEAQSVVMNLFYSNIELLARLGPKTGILYNKTRIVWGKLQNIAQSKLQNIAQSKLQNKLQKKQFVQRVKPLYFCSERETMMYAFLSKIKTPFIECPYSEEGFRASVRNELNKLESQVPGSKKRIILNFLGLLPALKKYYVEKYAQHGKERVFIRNCVICNEPSRLDKCNACRLVESFKRIR